MIIEDLSKLLKSTSRTVFGIRVLTFAFKTFKLNYKLQKKLKKSTTRIVPKFPDLIEKKNFLCFYASFRLFGPFSELFRNLYEKQDLFKEKNLDGFRKRP
jgi:hypothetical protein